MELNNSISPETGEMIKQIFLQQAKHEKEEKIERFRHLNPYVKKGQILFAGSSLMEQFPIYEFIQDYDLPYVCKWI